MGLHFLNAVSDLLHGVLFPKKTSETFQLLEGVNQLLMTCRQNSATSDLAPLSKRDIQREGLSGLSRSLSSAQSRFEILSNELKEKDKRVAGLESTIAGMKQEISELLAHVKLQEEQLQKSHHSEQYHVVRQQELEVFLSELLEAFESDSCESLVPENISEDIQGLAQAISSSLFSLHERFAQQSRDLESEKLDLLKALQQIARGEIPEDFAEARENADADAQWIKNAAITLQEIYAGNASVAATIQLSMEMLFAIARDLADGSARQMQSLEELQQTIEQMSQNTSNMAGQTDETAKVAQEIHLLLKTLMDEAEEMIAAVRESYQNIEDINDLMDQSSLLALNARIIAAQAGEQGRAFAVVAEAIKDLSAQTDTFVQLITERVQAITNSTTTVHEGVQRIAQSMGAVQQNSDQIASGAHEFSVSTQQVSRAVELILSRAQHSALLAKQLASMAKRISIALEQLTEMTQFFERGRGAESELYRIGETGERAALIPGIESLQDLQSKRLAAVFINKGPADQIHEYYMQLEAERQRLKLKIYSGENSARRSFQIAETLITSETIDVLFWQVTNNLTLQKILHLAEQHHVIVILFCRGGNVSKAQVPFQTLTQHYEEGKVAAECLPQNSSVFAVFGPEHLSIANTRAQGFLWNLPEGSRCLGRAHGDWTASEAAILMKNFLHENKPSSFNAIYGINDSSAFGAIQACLEHVMLELLQQRSLAWTPKHVIGTDVSEEMLQCMHGAQGHQILGNMLKKAIEAIDMGHKKLGISDRASGWGVRWDDSHEAVFSIRDGRISVQAEGGASVIIDEMVTVSHSSYFDKNGNPIGVGARAIEHLVECVQHPGREPYLVFSQELGVTKETPEAIWKSRRYMLTEAHIRWRNEHVMTLSPHGELTCVGK